MGKRVAVDLGYLQESIDALDSSVAWERLPMSQKVLVLLEDRVKLQHYEPGQVPENLDSPSLKAFLQKLQQKQRPDRAELDALAADSGLDRAFLDELCDRLLS